MTTDLEVVEAMRDATILNASNPMVARLFGFPPYKRPDQSDWEEFNARVRNPQTIVNAALTIIDERLGGNGDLKQLQSGIAQLIGVVSPYSLWGNDLMAADTILDLLKDE